MGVSTFSSPYAISRNKTSWVSTWLSSQLCLRAVLGTFVVAPLATGFVSIYLEILLCGHYHQASSRVFVLHCSQASLVPQFLFVFASPAPVHMQLMTSWTARCSFSARFSSSSSSVFAPRCPSHSEERGSEWQGNSPNTQPPHPQHTATTSTHQKLKLAIQCLPIKD